MNKLLKESQQDIRKLYESSSEEIDRLVNICDQLKLSCKLSGNGWGGCCIIFVEDTQAEEILETILEKYYSDSENKLALTDDLGMYAFITKPGKSASILDPSYEIWY